MRLKRAILAGLALLLMTVTAAAQEQDLVKLRVEEGRVAVFRNNRTMMLQAGQEMWLRPGDQITVGEGGRAVLDMGQGDQVTLEPNTAVGLLPGSKPGDQKGRPKVLNLGVKQGRIHINMGIEEGGQGAPRGPVLVVQQGDLQIRTRRLRGTFDVKVPETRLPEPLKSPHGLRVERGFAEVVAGMYMMHVRDNQEVVFQRRGSALGVDFRPQSQGTVMMMTFGAVISTLEPNQIVKAEINPAKTAVYVTNYSETLQISALPWLGAAKRMIEPQKTEVFRIVNVQVAQEEAYEKLRQIKPEPTPPPGPTPDPPGPVPPPFPPPITPDPPEEPASPAE